MSMPFDRQANESELQEQLRDLICLAVVGDHVRWVLTDKDELGDWLARQPASGGGGQIGWRRSWSLPESRRTGACARWSRTSP